MTKIPVTVIITTKNEERNIARCLQNLGDFSEVIVVDSQSTDKTCAIAESYGVRVEHFVWDGHYPKKRQWCLDNINFKNDWVFWLDADEELMPDIINEIAKVFHELVWEAGFFIRGQYVWQGQILHYGMKNNKIALMNTVKMEFPVVDDLRIEGMGEIEGHYQPVLKPAFRDEKIGQISSALLHHAYESEFIWLKRHQRYARWEAAMTRKGAWPRDPVLWREIIKYVLRRLPVRPQIMFFYSYIWKQGFLDGEAGRDFAMSRKRYCEMIGKLLKAKT